MVSNYDSYEGGPDFKTLVLTSALVAVILHGFCQSLHLNSDQISNSFKAQWLALYTAYFNIEYSF
jgi:hypothetical protein